MANIIRHSARSSRDTPRGSMVDVLNSPEDVGVRGVLEAQDIGIDSPLNSAPIISWTCYRLPDLLEARLSWHRRMPLGRLIKGGCNFIYDDNISMNLLLALVLQSLLGWQRLALISKRDRILRVNNTSERMAPHMNAVPFWPPWPPRL